MTEFFGTITVKEPTNFGAMTSVEYVAGIAEPKGGAWRRYVYDEKVYEGMADADHFWILCDVLEYAEANGVG